MPLISVVLPTYNGEKYISQSIESIIKQTLTDWELIIVNDNSTDNTVEIVEKYMRQDRRIKVIHNIKNQMLPMSLNIGFHNSCGKFLTWTSDDNLYLESAFEVMYRELISDESCPMVCANMQIIDEKGENIESFVVSDEIWFHNCIGACFLYKRNVYEKIGDYNQDLFLVEDYDYWMRILLEYRSIKCLSKCLYLYRRHSDSLSESKICNVIKQRIHFRAKYLGVILNHMGDNVDEVYKMYFDFLDYENSDLSIRQIAKFLPEFQSDVNFKIKNKQLLIFGAGYYGDLAFELLSDQIIAYADNDEKKVGSFKNGIQVLSFKDAVEGAISEKWDILIAVSKNKCFDIMHQLWCSGVNNYCSYEHYMKLRKN